MWDVGENWVKALMRARSIQWMRRFPAGVFGPVMALFRPTGLDDSSRLQVVEAGGPIHGVGIGHLPLARLVSTRATRQRGTNPTILVMFAGQ